MSVAGRVARGVKLLDENLPDWFNHVNPDILDMGHIYLCVLGQVFGDWGLGCSRLGIDSMNSDNYGFDGYSKMDYLLVEAEWRRVIRERRSA